LQTTHRNGDLPEGEGVSGDMIKRRLLLLLDGVFESACRLCIDNSDWKDLAGVITEYPAVELECGSHEVRVVDSKGRSSTDSWGQYYVSIVVFWLNNKKRQGAPRLKTSSYLKTTTMKSPFVIF
jgi:hypothetical protein